MNLLAKPIPTGRKLVPSKLVFKSSIAIILLTVLVVWLWGTTIHRTVFGNALLSTNILAAICATCFTIGLFNGVKLKDTLGKITDRFKWVKLTELSNTGGWNLGGNLEMGGEGFFEVLACLVVGLITSLLMLFFLWLFGNLL